MCYAKTRIDETTSAYKVICVWIPYRLPLGWSADAVKPKRREHQYGVLDYSSPQAKMNIRSGMRNRRDVL